MSGDNFDVEVSNRHVQAHCSLMCHTRYVGCHALWLCIDINADYLRLRHACRSPYDQPGLGASTAGAMHDCRRANGENVCLLTNLGNRCGVDNCTQAIRDSMRHEIGAPTLLFELCNKFTDCGVPVPCPRHMMNPD